MTLIYGLSGIALNHGVARHWNPGVITKSENYQYTPGIRKEEVGRDMVEEILELTGERANFKQYFLPNDRYLIIYLRGGQIQVELESGNMELIRIRNRPVFREVNYLHYNKPKKLWTWFSDIFAFSLILMAISGIIMVRGKKGIRGTGGILLGIGIVIPLLFLSIYLWF
jgi:hypothetical protein